jgi:FAD/FMN-containing dehydrogenase
MSYNVLERTIPSTGAPHAVDELSARLPGKVAVPGDPGWDETRMGWIRSVDQQPCAVVTVTSAQDVVEAVRFAARKGLSVAAQPVGHGATAAVNGTILLRTRGLQDIQVDAQNRVARVGAGVKWGELLAVTGQYGPTGLAGSSPDPSVVGFSVSGGLSWFGRAHGLAAHGIRAFEVVDRPGRAAPGDSR